MNNENNQPQAAIVDDAVTEKVKERARDVGVILNADAAQKRRTIARQTKTTRHLDQTVKQEADAQMADKKKGGKK